MDNTNLTIKQGTGIKNREFPEIDFLRFIAILLVVIFHFTVRWDTVIDYGKYFINPFWDYGWIGVQLFFIISGFVVTYTLSKSKNAKDFILKRITRIYPALWIILPIVYLFQLLTPYSNLKDRSTISNLLGSMTLIPPTILNLSDLISFDWLTLVLWSLKVEMIFYIVCAILYNYLSHQKVVSFISYICGASSLLLILDYELQLDNVYFNSIVKLMLALGFNYLPWFTIGMLCYKQKILLSNELFKIIFFSGLAIITTRSDRLIYSAVSASIVILLFLITIFIKFPKIFKNQFIQKLGVSSYEMYLIHQGVGIPILIFIINKFDLTINESIFLMVIIVSTLFILSVILCEFVTSKINIKFRQLLIKTT